MAQSAAGVTLHRLELRYAALRVLDAPAIARLAHSIAVNGQLVPCIAVAGEGSQSSWSMAIGASPRCATSGAIRRRSSAGRPT